MGGAHQGKGGVRVGPPGESIDHTAFDGDRRWAQGEARDGVVHHCLLFGPRLKRLRGPFLETSKLLD